MNKLLTNKHINNLNKKVNNQTNKAGNKQTNKKQVDKQKKTFIIISYE